MHGGNKELISYQILVEKLQKKDHLGDPSMDERKILKQILKKYGVPLC
jgi:hypothetical protein